MMQTRMQFLGDSKIGIFGAGHLGKALAGGLLAAGLPAGNLMVCHGTNPATRRSLIESGFEASIRASEELVRCSDIVFYTVQPQAYRAIAGHSIKEDSLFVSFLAGVPLGRLPLCLPMSRRVRAMISGPETIRLKRGIAAHYPAHSPMVRQIFSALGFTIFPMEHEQDLDAFTAFGPSLHVALAEWGRAGRKVNRGELIEAARRYNLPNPEELIAWAVSAQPGHLSADELSRYIAQAATPGGVTEAILNAVRSGQALPAALAQGVEHSMKLCPIAP